MSLKMVGPFHGHYKPCSRIILLSNDGQKFALNRYDLTRNSGFFRHLLELPRPTQRHAQPVGQLKGAQIARVHYKRNAKKGRPNEAAVDPSPDLISINSEPSPETVVEDGENEEAATNTLEESSNAQQQEIEDAQDDEDGWGVSEPKQTDRVTSDWDGKAGPGNVKPVKLVPKWAQADPLELDVGWKQLAEFLDLLKISQYVPSIVNAEHLAIGMTQIRSVLPLAKKYDCPKLLSALMTRLKAIAAKDPWPVLFLASDLDDTAVARIAIALFKPDQHFHNGGRGRSSGYLKEQIEKLRSSWQLALLKVLLPTTCQVDVQQHGATRLASLIEVDMVQVADSFNPSAEELPAGFTALPTHDSGEPTQLV